MAAKPGHVLIVDDNILNRKMLARAVMDQGHQVTTAEDGRQALALLRSGQDGPFDVILLDILMPEMDGYQVLEQVKADNSLHHIPVIMISALEEMDSVVRCIETGATDYLPKPFNPALLAARLNASLAEKRLRDLELEYLEQVDRVAGAAQAVEAARFDPDSLKEVAARDDALGQLARVFRRMAREVYLREQRLKQQLQQLQTDVEEMRRAFVEPLSVYIPMDRRQALVRGDTLPHRTTGAALFADISGFTPLTTSLAQELGLQRGAEELTRLLNQVYGALIAEVHRHRGSVIGFSGDAITCWLDDDPTLGLRGEPVEPAAEADLRAVACGLAMQQAMTPFGAVQTPTGGSFSLSIKIAIVTGRVRRFLAGDPQIQNIEVVAGRTLDELARAEHQAQPGEVVVQAGIVERAGGRVEVAGWHSDDLTGQPCAVVSGLVEPIADLPWPELPPDSLDEEQCQPWLLPAVYRRMCSGMKQYLAELRPAVALFLRFGGIDYDGDEDSGTKLDAYVRWVQRVIEEQEGALIQLTTGDKGSYLYAAFGAPVAHSDDEVRAVSAAMVLHSPPPELQFITKVQMGLAKGLMRTGAYGGPTQRTYGVLGEKTILAARLMQAAKERILCDEAVYQGAHQHIGFSELPSITVKGIGAPIRVFCPLGEQDRTSEGQGALQAIVDRLSLGEQLTLKVASVLGRSFSLAMMEEIYPADADKARLEQYLRALAEAGLVAQESPEGSCSFRTDAVRELAYRSMLFAQRRHLHRLAAEGYERRHGQDLAPHYTTLAHHWRQAEEPARAVDYLEKAGQEAARAGAYEEAERYLQESLELDAGSAVLSTEFYGPSSVDYEGAKALALEQLEYELSPELTYHNLFHTRDDVLPAVQRLAAMSGLEEEEVQLLEVAAAYHDLGFVVQRQEHERISAELAGEALPEFGFSQAQVAAIQGMIMATQLPQSPQTPLEEILADADLDVLGREDFFPRNEALRAEMARSGVSLSEEQWIRSQLKVLENHHYFTAAAQSLREEGKRKNDRAMEDRLTSLAGQAMKGGGSND